MKQCVEPESTKALKIMVFGRSEVVTGKNRALGSKEAAALRRTSSIAWSISSQPEVHVGCYYYYLTSWRLGFAVCRSSCLKADFCVPIRFLLPVPNTGRLSTEPVPLAREVWQVYQS